MSKAKEIEKLRKKVDTIDHKLVFLLAERFEATKEIILLKVKNELPVEDKGREEYILNEASKLARKLKIRTKFIEDIFKKVLKESKRR